MHATFAGLQAAFRSLHYGQFLDLVYKHQQRPIIPDHMPEDYALLVEVSLTS
jgi:hypothetical protein